MHILSSPALNNATLDSAFAIVFMPSVPGPKIAVKRTNCIGQPFKPVRSTHRQTVSNLRHTLMGSHTIAPSFIQCQAPQSLNLHRH
jgi:hypothetical protein